MSSMNNNILQFPDSLNPDDDVSTQAAYWISKINMGQPSPEQFKEFMRWKYATPQNTEAFVKLAAIYTNHNQKTARNLDQTEPETTSEIANPPYNQSEYLSFSLKISIAASLLIGVCLLVMSDLSFNSQTSPQTLDLVTQIGEQKAVELGDGSRVLLNTDSQVEVRFEEGERRIQLISGEAHFDVAHDAKRPFKVYTPHGNVGAVGTAFNINLADQQLAVTVTEGRVAVSSAELYGRQESRPLAMVDAGHQVLVADNTPQVKSIDKSSVERRIAWHKGLLIFDGDSLKSVIAQISRYTDKSIIITDPELEEVQIGGQFKTSEIDGLLESLDSGFGISAHYTDDNRILLSRKISVESAEPKI